MPLVLALLLAQAGPSVGGGAGPALPQAPLDIRRQRTVSLPSAPAPSRLGQCLEAAQSDPESALNRAEAWLTQVSGSARVDPGTCLGAAYAQLGRWDEAEAAYIAAREVAAANERGRKGQLGALAGNAALAANSAARAEGLFALAHAESLAASDRAQAGRIAADWASALVAQGKVDEAAGKLALARAEAPDLALAWLLSATLARRQDKLAEAQEQIETAARLDPRDPEIGLEAGVIAVLARRDEAARRSWRSVLAMAPGSTQAQQAQAYLDQLGGEAAPSGR